MTSYIMEQPTNTTDVKGLKQMVPEVTWAQRSSTTEPEKNHIYMTIVVPDVKPENLKLDLQSSSLEFTGYSESKKATYHVKMDLFAEIDPKESKINHSSRWVELVLRKNELKEEYWPRLLKDKQKVHYLKTNFDKWVDEDEQDAVPEDDDYMARMGGMGGAGGMGGGMEGMGGMGGDGGFGGIDFSKLGGGAGGAGGMPDLSALQGMMGGMGGGMPGMGGDEGEDDDDDDDMPELEETEEANAGASKSSKIEEVE
ncbi:HSP20-like chaperone [Aureobasidium pullulans]|uniref:HSP20-like chaperone n=1 Tax=Aureobasidium pullulans TaxID=5580 RepID=A0A4S9BEV6_AURPU|nr:HSP20-like chaperone [Aureobasidium pullulans]